MKIVACIKQVPDTAEIILDPQSGLLMRDKAPAILNPFDAYVVEEALQITEQLGGQVTALTMGPASALDVLHEAMSMGAQEVLHLCDAALAGADTYATARVLATAIAKLAGIDLIICGKQSIEGGAAQVGPQLAEMLGLPHVAYVKKIRQVEENRLIVERMVESGVEVLELRLPALITVLKDINTPRMPSFRLKIQAKKRVVPVWGLADLGLSEAAVGLAGSLTALARAYTAEPRGACEMLSGTHEQMIAALFARLQAAEL